MKTYKIQYKGGTEPFKAYGANEARQLFKLWARAKGIAPIILAIFN